MKNFCRIASLFLILVSFLGCKPDVEVKVKTGSIQGRVVYDNGNVKDYSGIQVTLFSTNGLMATDYCISRGISANARSVESTQITNESGEYFFENVPEGVYTIYASSNSSTKKAVATNVVVRASEIVTAEDLGLTATGSIRGTISFADTTADFLGFDVFIAGTSFIAKVDNYGYFEISNIPAGTGYVLCLQKGDKTKIIEENVEVRPDESPCIGETLELHEWETNAFNWLGPFEIAPENPKKYDAYYNSLDGCSYIYNGTNWELLAKAGTDGEDGKDGVIGKDGEKGDSIKFLGSYPNASYIYNPQNLDVYFNTTEGQSYIYNGSSWTLLVQKGDTGTDGKNGSSIDWRGDFASEDEVLNPEYLDAYFNTTDGCSYIYSNKGWELLVYKGAEGTNGDSSPNDNNIDATVYLGEITEEIDGITYIVKKYANVYAGSDYFYTIYKNYYLNNKLKRTWVSYHSLGSVDLDYTYYEYVEHTCGLSPSTTNITDYYDNGKIKKHYQNIQGTGYIERKFSEDGSILEYNVIYATTKTYTTYYSSGYEKTYKYYSPKGEDFYLYLDEEYFDEVGKSKKKSIVYNSDGKYNREEYYSEPAKKQLEVYYNSDGTISRFLYYYESGYLQYYYDDSGYLYTYVDGETKTNSTSVGTRSSCSSTRAESMLDTLRP